MINGMLLGGRSLFGGRRTRSGSKPRGPTKRQFRPLLERLEDRTVFATQLVMSGFTAATAGTAEILMVRAIDTTNGQTDTSYTGKIHFASSDLRAAQLGGLPADYTFQTADNGVQTFSVTLYTPGTQSLTATDLLDNAVIPGSLTTSQTVSVFTQAPDPAGGYYKSSWYAPNSQGMDGDQYAYDDFTLSSAQTINEIAWRGCYTNYLSGAGKSPVYDFTISIYASIAAGIQPDVISPPLLQYSVGGNAGETLAGTVGGVQMYDYNCTLPIPFQAQAGTKYWVQIEASQSVTPFYGWPPDWSIAAGAGGDGSHFAMITGGTLAGGNRYVALSGDLAFSLLTAPSVTGITVSPGATSQFVVSAHSTMTVGVPGSVTVTAQDAYGNVTPAYSGTVHFASNDSLAVLPADYTYLPTDQGTQSFSATLSTVGVWTISVSDTSSAPPVIVGQSGNIVANPPVSLGALTLGQWTSGRAGYSGRISISGGTGSYRSLSVTGLPAGLRAAITGHAVTFGGTSTSVGTYVFTLSLSDNTGATASQNYSLTVLPATTLAWTGRGGSNLWTDAGNWTGAAPGAGSTLIFGAGALQKANINNFAANTLFNTIVFQDPGYSLSGKAIRLSRGIRAIGTGVGTDTVALNIAMTASQTFNVGAGETLLVTGAISGTGFGVTKAGDGTLRYAGNTANTYTGSTTVNGGVFEMDKAAVNAIAAALIIKNGRVAYASHNNQIADTAAVKLGIAGTLDLAGRSDRLGSLTLTGGTITTGAGTLALGGNLVANAAAVAATISGNLNLGGLTRTITVADGGATEDLVIAANISNGGITKAGTGALELSGTNTYAGVTTVNAGVLDARNSFALGTTKGGTVVAAGATLELEEETNQSFTEALTLGNTKGGATLLMLGGTNTWAGNITLAATSTINVGDGQLSLSGAISGPGGVNKVGTGTLVYSGSAPNTYKGRTTISAGQLLLNKSTGVAVAGDLAVGAGAGVVYASDNQVADTAAVTVGAGASFDLNNHSDRMGALMLTGGAVATGTGTLTLGGNITSNAAAITATIAGNLNLADRTCIVTVADGAANPDLIISAVIGHGTLIKTGPGTLA